MNHNLNPGDCFTNFEIMHIIEIMEILPSGMILVEITRNGFSGIHQLKAEKVLVSLLNPELYTRS